MAVYCDWEWCELKLEHPHLHDIEGYVVPESEHPADENGECVAVGCYGHHVPLPDSRDKRR